MDIILKPKYNNFINIIDNYKNEDENKANKQTEVINKLVQQLQDIEVLVKEPNNIKQVETLEVTNNLQPEIVQIVQNTEHEIYEQQNNNYIENIKENTKEPDNKSTITKENEENKEKIIENEENKENKEKIIENEEIFKKLHLLISDSKKKEKLDQNSKKEIFNDSIEEKFVQKDNVPIIDNKKKSSTSKSKNNLNEEEQKEKLEKLYEQKIYEQKMLTGEIKVEKEKKKNMKDELKKLCKEFEEKCVMESVRGFSVHDDLYYLDLPILTKNINEYNKSISENFNCSILYRNYKDNKIIVNPDKKIGWVEIDKNGEKFVASTNKYLLACLKTFEKTNKFRKTINEKKMRAFKLTFLVYKTKIRIDIFAIIKSNN